MILVPLTDLPVWRFLSDLPAVMRHSMLPGYAHLPLPPKE